MGASARGSGPAGYPRLQRRTERPPNSPTRSPPDCGFELRQRRPSPLPDACDSAAPKSLATPMLHPRPTMENRHGRHPAMASLSAILRYGRLKDAPGGNRHRAAISRARGGGIAGEAILEGRRRGSERGNKGAAV